MPLCNRTGTMLSGPGDLNGLNEFIFSYILVGLVLIALLLDSTTGILPWMSLVVLDDD